MKNDTPEELLVNRFSVGEQQYALLSYRTPPPRFAFGLTESEWVVALFLLAGHSSASIATTRGVSARTIANQINRIFHKFGVRSRRELLASWSRRLDDLTDPEEQGPRQPSP
jgi:DNA-binding CsgD family transcriptional regulator